MEISDFQGIIQLLGGAMKKYKILTIIIIVLVVLNIYQFQQSSSLNKKLENNFKMELNASFSEAKEMLANELPTLISRKEISRLEFDNIWHSSNNVLFGIDESLTFANHYDIYSEEYYPKNTNKLAGEVQSFYRKFLNSNFQDNIESVPLSEKDIKYIKVLKELFESIGALTTPKAELMNIEETLKKLNDISSNYEEKLKKIRLF